MATQFHNEPDDDDDNSWTQDTVPVRHSYLSSPDQPRRWLAPALVSTITLILILAFGVHSGGLTSRMSSLKDTVSNLTLSLSYAQKNSREAVKDMNRLRFSVENNEDQLRSVVESLKQLSAVDYLSNAVASLKCAVDRIIYNRTDVSGCCPLEWEPFESSCFFFSKTLLNWHDARDWCHAHESQLLMLTSNKVWNYAGSHAGGKFHWIGLTDESGKWLWVNGTEYTVDHRRWMPGQPDNWANHGLGEGTEDCAHLHRTGLLNDLHCSERLRFICQAHNGL